MDGKRVLLIDDDDIFHLIHTKLLKASGFAAEVVSASNGKHALQLLQSCETLPDVILVDLNMPVMDGFCFIEAFNQLEIKGKENIFVSILSSSRHAKDIERAESLGVNYYLSKPLDLTTLANEMANFERRSAK
jgi:CheY-like chemotaxis protein